MTPDVDGLLEKLRRTAVCHPRLHEVEGLVWQRIHAEERRLQRRQRLPLQAIAVVGAFVWGVIIGLDIATERVQPRLFLGAEAEILSPDRSGLLL